MIGGAADAGEAGVAVDFTETPACFGMVPGVRETNPALTRIEIEWNGGDLGMVDDQSLSRDASGRRYRPHIESTSRRKDD